MHYLAYSKKGRTIVQKGAVLAQVYIWGRGLTLKGYKGACWGDGNSLCYDYDGAHTPIHICPYLSNFTHKMGEFYRT